MKSAIEVIGKSECTGCFGCVNACPISNAIEMKFDNEGFYKANITNYCIHCGKCQKFCPIIDYSSRNLLKKVYAAWSLDSEILKKVLQEAFLVNYQNSFYQIMGLSMERLGKMEGLFILKYLKWKIFINCRDQNICLVI